MSLQQYPGTPEHQRLLRAIASYYDGDPRIRAVAVFGSLGRGTWDGYSDLDLDVVIDDQVNIDPMDEVSLLCQALGEQPVLVLQPMRKEAELLAPLLV